MCIGLPMRIESGDATAAIAVVEGADGAIERARLDMLIVGEQPPGTWVLAHRGAAQRVLDPLEAKRIRDALAALQLAAAGGGEGDSATPAIDSVFDALFADLVGRAPQLPEHLRR